MPVATVRGVDIHYQVLGERGPWLGLQPGGRRALAGVKSLGENIAEALLEIPDLGRDEILQLLDRYAPLAAA